jgi:hypothetical protein
VVPAGAVPLHEDSTIKSHLSGLDRSARVAELETSVLRSVRDAKRHAEIVAWKKKRDSIRLEMCEAIEVLAKLYGAVPEVTVRLQQALEKAAKTIRAAGIADVVTKIGPEDDQLLTDARNAIGLVLEGDEAAAAEVSQVLAPRANMKTVKKMWSSFESAALEACFEKEREDFDRDFPRSHRTVSTDLAGSDHRDRDGKPLVRSEAERSPAKVAVGGTSNMELKTIHMVEFVQGRQKGKTVDDALAELKFERPADWEHVEPSSMHAMYYRAKKKLERTT